VLGPRTQWGWVAAGVAAVVIAAAPAVLADHDVIAAPVVAVVVGVVVWSVVQSVR
jgi:hypothetical protein